MNLGCKLAATIRGTAPAALLDKLNRALIVAILTFGGCVAGVLALTRASSAPPVTDAAVVVRALPA